MGKRIRSKRFKSKKAMSKKVRSKRFKSKRNYKKTMKKRINKIKKIKIKKGGQVLGEGGFGKVELYTVQVNRGKACFVKKIAKDNKDEVALENFKNEFDILSKMDHINIVKVFRMRESGNEYYLEFCNASDLFEYINNKKADIPDYGCLENSNRYSTILGGGSIVMDRTDEDIIIRGILSGLNHIHSNGYVHGDIKPENILLTYHEQVKFTAKIADFGLSYPIGRPHLKDYTTEYIPFECLYYGGISHDYWACGVVILTFNLMNLDISKEYKECLHTDYRSSEMRNVALPGEPDEKNIKTFNISKLNTWREKYLYSKALRDIISNSDMRGYLRKILLTPKDIDLDELDLEGDVIDLYDYKNGLASDVYEYFLRYRKEGYQDICELYNVTDYRR